MRSVAVLAILVIAAAWGFATDRAEALSQPWLFAAIQFFSLSGCALGAWLVHRRFRRNLSRGLFALLAIAVWRISYFPIMVFSGHVASIGEWLMLLLGTAVFVYPVFFASVSALHGAAVVAARWIVRPDRPLLALALAPAFAMAVAVSFSVSRDLTILPDTVWSLDSEVPPAVEAAGNPYLPALMETGFTPQQRVMLAAAGVTYATIPPSPWATTVKAVLEELFHRKPVAATADRVLEHYLAYHASHRFIGCRGFDECPVDGAPGGEEDGQEAGEPADP